MKNMLKYSAIAAAVAMSGSATAGDVLTYGLDVMSSEFLTVEANPEATYINGVAYRLGAAYAVGDQIVITHNNFDVEDVTSWPSTVSGTNGTVTLTVGLLSETATTKTYRVTEISGGSDTTDIVLDFGQKATTFGQLRTAGGMSFSVASTLSDGETAIDTSGTRQNTAVLVASQIGGTEVISSFDNVIDVGTARRAFESGRSDSASIGYTIKTSDNDSCVVENAAGACLASFNSWYSLELDEFTPVASITADLETDLEEETGVSITSAEATEIVYEDNVIGLTFASGTTVAGIQLTNPAQENATVLRPQTFTYDASVNYGTSSSVEVASGAALGAWTLNGAEVVVPYMPYGPGISQIIYVSNHSDQDGDIYVTAIDEAGNSYDLGMIGTAGAGSVTKITDEVYQGLGLDSARVSMNITVNAPSKDVEVFAAYNARGNRLSVNPTKKN